MQQKLSVILQLLAFYKIYLKQKILRVQLIIYKNKIPDYLKDVIIEGLLLFGLEERNMDSINLIPLSPG